MPKFVVVSYPDSVDCYVTILDNLDKALETYTEQHTYSASPILAQILEVQFVAEEIKAPPVAL